MDCALVNPEFAGPDGLDANQLMVGLDPESAMLLEFVLGETILKESGSLPAEGRMLYRINLEGGSTLDLEVTGANPLPQFDVIAPSGLIVARSESQASLVLPHSGQYQIILHQSGGATPYQLKLTRPGR
ncbi:MAG: hypothetical protein HC922_08245 [Leptolyngbyaceae cyanobacterium SM2_3_12]|nr:hypothetical protein [Leptolyngbyaceae cyanobacterium SM2_3_12]